MKYRFAVEAIFTKEIEVEAESEQEAYEKAGAMMPDVTYAPDDESGFDRELWLINN